MGALAAFSLLALLWGGPCAEEKELESQYRLLETLVFSKLRTGYKRKDIEELRRIRDFFISKGDAGGQFLVGKLELMNADEMRFLNGSDDPYRGIEYWVDVLDQGKTASVKYNLCFILADMFPQLSSGVQEAVLKAIAASYTPSAYGREDMQFLHYSLTRAGPRSVPYFLELATRRSEHVRCGVGMVLDSIAEEALSGLPASTKPPRLEPLCRAADEERGKALAAWKEWWEQEGHKGAFPKLPSFFDLSPESYD